MVTRAVPSTTIQCSERWLWHLQRQGRTGMHDDALNTEAVG